MTARSEYLKAKVQAGDLSAAMPSTEALAESLEDKVKRIRFAIRATERQIRNEDRRQRQVQRAIRAQV